MTCVLDKVPSDLICTLKNHQPRKKTAACHPVSPRKNGQCQGERYIICASIHTNIERWSVTKAQERFFIRLCLHRLIRSMRLHLATTKTSNNIAVNVHCDCREMLQFETFPVRRASSIFASSSSGISL